MTIVTNLLNRLHLYRRGLNLMRLEIREGDLRMIRSSKVMTNKNNNLQKRRATAEIRRIPTGIVGVCAA